MLKTKTLIAVLMKLRLLPNFVSKLRQNYFTNSGCKNNVPAIKKSILEECEKTLPTRANQTRRTRAIRGTKSINELLLLIGNTKKGFGSAEIAASCQKLSEHVFQMLKFQPWAVCDERILWYQSKINTGADLLSSDILQTSEFSFLLREVKKHIDIFTSGELLTITKSLLHLHVPTGEDHVMLALVNECIGRRHDFNLSELATFSIVGNRLYRSGIPILCYVAQTVQELAAEKPLCKDLDDFRSFSTIVTNILYISSESLLILLLPSFDEIFKYEFQQLEVHLDAILSCAEAFKLLLAKRGEYATFTEKIASFFVDHMDTLSLQQLGRACILITKLGLMSQSLSDMFQKRANEFLHHKCLSPTDVMSIIQIADKTISNKTLITETVNALENVVVDFDVQLLKFLARTNFLLKAKNDIVNRKFSQCVLARLPDITNEIPSLESILYIFSLLHYKNNSFHKQMIELLVHKLQDGQMGLMPVHVAHVFRYITSCGRFDDVPTDLKETLSQMMDQMSFRDLCNLAYQVNCQISSKYGYAKSSKIWQLASLIKDSALQRINEVNSLAMLNFLMGSFFRNFTAKESRLIHFSTLYDKYANTVDNISLKAACKILQNHRLFAQQALQCFADFVISDVGCQNDLGILSLYLETCALLNFCPTNISDIQELVLKKLTQQYTGSDIHLNAMLSIVRSFVILEVFPKELLNLVFSLGFLKEFDTICQGASSLKRQHYDAQLYSLNRSVCLDCPYLNIPWFHEVLGKGSSCRIPHLRKTIILDQVTLEQQLEEVLGGPEYLKTNVITPYFYKLDFECVLMKSGTPVARSQWNKLSEVQRVAILLLSEEDFCRNVQKVLGPVAMKLRHLEMMGYRVVPVPYYKLHSSASLMSMENAVDLKDFLRLLLSLP